MKIIQSIDNQLKFFSGVSSSFVRERAAAKSECLKFLHQQLIQENIQLEADVSIWLTNEKNGISYIPEVVCTESEFSVSPFSLKRESKLEFYKEKTLRDFCWSKIQT